MISSGTAQAKPSIEDVQHRVDRLYHAAEQASERYNQIHVQLTQMRGDVHALRADQARQQRRTEQARQVIADSIIQQYEGDSLSAVGRAVVAKDPNQFVSQLTTMSAFNSMQASQYSSFLTEAKALKLRQAATDKQMAKIAALEKQAAQDKATIDHNLAAAKSLLGNLKAAQRQRMLAASRSTSPTPVSSTSSTPTSSAPASGRAAAAVAYAMAQVGKAYVYGGAGPDAFDCSGLTMAAWGVAGVGLPHSAAAQYNSGTHISASQLQPGDLVFYYSPISHVGMYIGNGQIVNAENPSVGVTVTGLYTMPYVGAVRPG
ncbi:MAG: C40 family peptidase [Nocardioides sp.]|nr:C40 family peptidase [Nocardioides sp.]